MIDSFPRLRAKTVRMSITPWRLPSRASMVSMAFAQLTP